MADMKPTQKDRELVEKLFLDWCPHWLEQPAGKRQPSLRPKSLQCKDCVAKDFARARQKGREEALAAVPTNWLDSLLSGPNKVGEPPLGAPEVERLLLCIRERIQALSGASQS